jgi:hypothetical protein
VKKGLAKLNGAEIVLNAPELCYFLDMAKFIPWNAQSNPFGAAVVQAATAATTTATATAASTTAAPASSTTNTAATATTK